MTGFLTGLISDYLDEFDAQIAKMESQLDKDSKYWSNQLVKLENGSAEMTAKMTQALTEFKSAFLQAMFEGCTLKETPAFDITRFPMKDLERFGVEIGNKIFRWPEG